MNKVSDEQGTFYEAVYDENKLREQINDPANHDSESFRTMDDECRE
jgi:hypothetical protein